MTLNVQMNGHSLDLDLHPQLGNMSNEINLFLSNDFNDEYNTLPTRSKQSIVQCHLFTHFHLLTFDEKRFSLPSYIGTYQLFKDNNDDFEVLCKHDPSIITYLSY